jgi:SAM-dependent methyltransferase
VGHQTCETLLKRCPWYNSIKAIAFEAFDIEEISGFGPDAVRDRWIMNKLFYELGYRHFRMPWEVGPRRELVELVGNGRIAPGRAIDLGCGSGANAIFLAQHGFDVTGVDFASEAIEKAKRSADEAGVSVRFMVDDLTNLRTVEGPFDFLVDYGSMDDLSAKDRDLYRQNVLPLTHPGSHYLLWGHEWPVRWWEKVFASRGAFEPGEAEHLFGDYFDIERIAGTDLPEMSKLQPGYAAYLMRRKPVPYAAGSSLD